MKKNKNKKLYRIVRCLHTSTHITLGSFCVRINLATLGNTNLLWFTFIPRDPITFVTKVIEIDF